MGKKFKTLIIIVVMSVSLFIIFSPIGPVRGDNNIKKIEKTLGEKPISCYVIPNFEIKRSTIENRSDGKIDLVEVRSCDKTVRFYEATPKVVDSKTPLVFALHQTTKFGKDEVMGYAGDSNLSYGKRFFDNGYIVIAPDIFIAGENYDEKIGYDTKDFYELYPNWSAMGKMLEDHKAVANYARRKFGDRCYGVIGHSLGGHNALFLAAFNKDIDVLISSAGFTSMETDSEASRWARSSWFIYMPLLRPYLTSNDSNKKLPWDFSDLLQSVTPRAALIIHGKNDSSWSNNSSVPRMVYDINAQSPYKQKIEMIFHNGGHEFGVVLQDQAINFATKSCAFD